jgi:hypothetical protein
MNKTKYFNLGNLHLVITSSQPFNCLHLGINLSDDCEHTISFSLSLPYIFNFNLYYNSINLVRSNWWKNFLRVEYGKRETSFSVWKEKDAVEGGYNLCLCVWDADFAGCNNRRGFSKFLNTTTLIYGHFDCKTTILNESTKRVFIPGIKNYNGDFYDLIIKEELYSYVWRRFNKRMSFTKYSVDCESGVPYGFKWGHPDRTYGITFGSGTCNSEQEAVEAFIEDIRQSRLKI